MRFTPILVALLALTGCRPTDTVQHRERAPDRDKGCVEPGLPFAYFYPAKNRTDYGPDDPKKDGCALLVPDHLFCCPKP
jgi:hypothetical protein